ncbi:DNA-binding protein [Geobacillus sp. CCR]
MGVIRVQKNSNYVVMSKVGLHDDRLSWKAKGLLAYMLSMPDNWTFYNEELMKHSPDGSSTFKSAMNELKQYGYVVRQRVKDEKGKFIGWETVVYEHPVDEDHRELENRRSENRRSENRRSENRRSKIDPLLNNKELNNELTNNELINDDDRPNPIKEFELAFGYLPPSILQQEFDHVISEGQFQEPEAIICEVIKRARENAPRNPAKYISSILKNLEYMGLFTLKAVREYNELHDQKTKRVGKLRKAANEVDWEAL